jgi:hypothetical protein
MPSASRSRLRPLRSKVEPAAGALSAGRHGSGGLCRLSLVQQRNRPSIVGLRLVGDSATPAVDPGTAGRSPHQLASAGWAMPGRRPHHMPSAVSDRWLCTGWVLGEGTGAPQRAEAVLHALVGESAAPCQGRPPSGTPDQSAGRTSCVPLPDRHEHLDRLTDIAERPTAALAQLHALHLASRGPCGGGQQHLAPGGGRRHPGRQVDVAPNQSPSRSTAEPVCMPTRTRGSPCWAPTSCTMHNPSRIAAAASAVRSISASPMVLTSWPDWRPGAGARPYRTHRQGRRPPRPHAPRSGR